MAWFSWFSKSFRPCALDESQALALEGLRLITTTYLSIDLIASEVIESFLLLLLLSHADPGIGNDDVSAEGGLHGIICTLDLSVVMLGQLDSMLHHILIRFIILQ